MKKLILSLIVLTAAGVLVGQSPSELKLWKSSDLKAYAPKLSARAGASKLATQSLATLNGKTLVMVHREATLDAEYHESDADFMIVQDGSCTMVAGGTVKNPKTTGPGEIRGPSIEGGQTYKLEVGDVMNIPAKTAHQVVISDGGKVTYLTLKVAAK
jgi:mannose-6-phosphate isomerase-like protein (cupin superfamily)